MIGLTHLKYLVFCSSLKHRRISTFIFTLLLFYSSFFQLVPILAINFGFMIYNYNPNSRILNSPSPMELPNMPTVSAATYLSSGLPSIEPASSILPTVPFAAGAPANRDRDRSESGVSSESAQGQLQGPSQGVMLHLAIQLTRELLGVACARLLELDRVREQCARTLAVHSPASIIALLAAGFLSWLFISLGFYTKIRICQNIMLSGFRLKA